MRNLRGPMRWAAGCACVLFVVSCGDDGGGVTDPQPRPAEREPEVAVVEITPGEVSLSSVGSSAELTAVARDADGAVISGAPFVWQSSDPTVVVVDPAGRVVAKGPGKAVVTAVAAGVPAHVPATVTQTATALAFRTQPGDGVAGEALSPAIQVEIRDEAGNRVPGATDAVTLSLSGVGEGAELLGTRTVNAVDGVATFSGLSLERAGSGFRMRARAGELEEASSEEFSVVPGEAARLGFARVPEVGVAGDTREVRVELQDAYGNLVPEASGTIALTLGDAPEGATLGGTFEVDAEGGVAAFHVVLERADSAYTLAAAAAGLAGARSGRIRVVPTEPAALAFVVAPDTVHVGVSYTYKIGVVDSFGNRVPDVDSVRVWIDNDTLHMMDGEVEYEHAVMASRFGTLYALPVDLEWAIAIAQPVIMVEWQKVFSGYDRSCGITTYMFLYCWGSNATGKLGTTGGSQERPIPVAAGRRWLSVALGRDHTCAIEAGGAAYCWGSNEYGQLGINDPVVTSVDEPTGVDSNQRFLAISAGDYHTCAVTTSRRAYCWGRNNRGQLGSDGGDEYAPTPVSGELEFRQISAGGNHTCALQGSSVRGIVYCWGDNGFGQLGNGSRTSVSAPDSVEVRWEFTDISAGRNHTCGIDWAFNHVWCWGSNAHGQLGRGLEVSRDTVPIQLYPNQFEADRIDAGDNHTCIITRGADAAYCWGENRNGQLGTGDALDRARPAAVAGGHRFESISAGAQHSCAITLATDGRQAYCWGSDRNGRLGTFAEEDSYLPVVVRP